jgi:MoaD family protein
LGDVKVLFSEALVNITNNEKAVRVDASSVLEVLEKLVEKYGDGFKDRIFESENELRGFINIYVNRKDIRFLKGLKTSVKAGDEIILLPAVSGGIASGSSRVSISLFKGKNLVSAEVK